MVTCLPTEPLRAAALAVRLIPADMPVAELRQACNVVLLRGHELGDDAATALAGARRLADTIDRGLLA